MINTIIQIYKYYNCNLPAYTIPSLVAPSPFSPAALLAPPPPRTIDDTCPNVGSLAPKLKGAPAVLATPPKKPAPNAVGAAEVVMQAVDDALAAAPKRLAGAELVIGGNKGERLDVLGTPEPNENGGAVDVSTPKEIGALVDGTPNIAGALDVGAQNTGALGGAVPNTGAAVVVEDALNIEALVDDAPNMGALLLLKLNGVALVGVPNVVALVGERNTGGLLVAEPNRNEAGTGGPDLRGEPDVDAEGGGRCLDAERGEGVWEEMASVELGEDLGENETWGTATKEVGATLSEDSTAFRSVVDDGGATNPACIKNRKYS